MQTRVSRYAFSLVELLAVLVLISLLTGASLLAVRLPIQKAQRERVWEQVQAIDALARSRARAGSHVELLWDNRKRAFHLHTDNSRHPVRSVYLPSGMRLGQFIVAGAGKSQSGSRSLSYTRFGTSHSYAIGLQNSSGSDSWLMVCGLSGEAYRMQFGSQTEGDVLGGSL